MLTVVVVLPTPPFWLATVSTRVRGGRGTARPLRVMRRRASSATARASGCARRHRESRPRSGRGARCRLARWGSSMPSLSGVGTDGLTVHEAADSQVLLRIAHLEPAVCRLPRCRPPPGVFHVKRCPGQANRAGWWPDLRAGGNPSPGAADRSSATSIVVLTRAHLLAGVQGVPIQPHEPRTRQSATPIRDEHLTASLQPPRHRRSRGAVPRETRPGVRAPWRCPLAAFHVKHTVVRTVRDRWGRPIAALRASTPRAAVPHDLVCARGRLPR